MHPRGICLVPRSSVHKPAKNAQSDKALLKLHSSNRMGAQTKGEDQIPKRLPREEMARPTSTLLQPQMLWIGGGSSESDRLL
jgi:hypothetical protein